MGAEAPDREWIEFEMYGPIWQPGVIAWRDGRIDPFHDWPLIDDQTERWTEAYVNNVGDFSAVTDWRATYVRQSSERFVSDPDDVERVTTYRRLIREWDDPDAAAEAYDDCHPEWDDDSDE